MMLRRRPEPLDASCTVRIVPRTLTFVVEVKGSSVISAKGAPKRNTPALFDQNVSSEGESPCQIVVRHLPPWNVRPDRDRLAPAVDDA